MLLRPDEQRAIADGIGSQCPFAEGVLGEQLEALAGVDDDATSPGGAGPHCGR